MPKQLDNKQWDKDVRTQWDKDARTWYPEVVKEVSRDEENIFTAILLVYGSPPDCSWLFMDWGAIRRFTLVAKQFYPTVASSGNDVAAAGIAYARYRDWYRKQHKKERRRKSHSV